MPLRLLVFFTALNLLNYFDRYIVHSVEPLLRSEFSLTNAQSGFVGAAFVVGYVIFSPLFGYLGDRFDRRLLMAFGLLAWSIFTGLASFATGLYSFLVLRALVGVGEASFSSIVPGYLKGRVSDTIALNSALSVFYVAIPVGSALGYVAGGITAQSWGWRALFGAAAIPGILLALGFWFVGPDKSDSHATTQRVNFFSGVKSIVSVPVLRWTIVGYIFNTFALNGVAYFVAAYGSGFGMDMAEVDWYFGIILVCTGIIGTLGGGRLASWFAKGKDDPLRAMLFFVSITTFVGVPFLGVAFLAGSPELFFGACFFAELALFAGVAPLNSVIVGYAPKGLETLTQGVTIFSIQLFGSALAPIAIGKLADVLNSMGAHDSAAAHIALGYALQLATLSMVFSSLVWFFAARPDSVKVRAAL